MQISQLKSDANADTNVLCERTFKLAGVAKWIASSLVEQVALDWTSLLPKLEIQHCLSSAACMREVQKKTVYTPIGGKGRCSNRCDPFVHHMQQIVQAREAPWL